MSESLDRPIEVPELTAEQIQARVLHRDGLMLVIDKPAGLPVHRGPKGGANLESSFDALRFGLPRPPVLAHRLDRDTSGCLVLGRHRKATASLGLLFKHGRISKTYWAVVEGGPTEDEGTIDLPLGRLNAERGWWQKPDPEGQPATTKWKVLGRGNGLTWLAMEPVTGRTHQLLALGLRTIAGHGGGEALQNAFLERGDDGVVTVALAADRRRVGQFVGGGAHRLQHLLLAAAGAGGRRNPRQRFQHHGRSHQ